MDANDLKYLQHSLHLAKSGYGEVNPNPLVGAVIVNEGVMVGEGFHRRFGEDHAEVDAIRRAGNRARGGTLYVNLEPCNHHGKTPPCTDAIIKAGITRVVYAADDPNPEVTGNGRRKLEENGITVVSGLLHDEAVKLNEHFYFAVQAKIPFVILKAAVTLDGYIADYRQKSKWITGEKSRDHVQYIRRGVDAILVGAGTVNADNPQLTVRGNSNRQPYRIVVDGSLQSSPGAKIYNDEFRSRTMVICLKKSKISKKIKQLEKKGVTVLQFKNTDKKLPVRLILRELYNRNIHSLLVEGGSDVFSRFVKSKLYARVLYFIAPKLLGGGTNVVRGIDRSLKNAFKLINLKCELSGEDVLIRGETELYGKYIR